MLGRKKGRNVSDSLIVYYHTATDNLTEGKYAYRCTLQQGNLGYERKTTLRDFSFPKPPTQDGVHVT